MRNSFATVIAMAALASSATAQVVYPAFYADSEGVNVSSSPFSDVGRLQQFCPDLVGGSPLVIRSISFRRDSLFANATAAVARTVTVDVWMAETTVWPPVATFALNYSSAPTLVASGLVVNLPDLRTLPRLSPAPFNVTLTLQTPFSYTATSALVFEIVVTSTSAGVALYPLDGATGTNLIAYGNFLMNGTGCLVNGIEVTNRARIQDNNIPGGWNTSFQWQVRGAPANAAALLFLGFTNPNAPVPGLCSPTNAIYALPLVMLTGVTDAAGAFDPFLPAIQPFNYNLVGAPIETQAVVLDATQPGLPAVVSNGCTARIVAPPPTMQLARVYATGNANATTGTVNPSLAAVVQFN